MSPTKAASSARNPTLAGNAAELFVRHPNCQVSLNPISFIHTHWGDEVHDNLCCEMRKATTEHSLLTLDVQDNLTLNDKPNPPSNGMRPPPPNRSFTDKQLPGPPRSENIPPRETTMHRPTRSQEQAMRTRGPGGVPGRGRPSNEMNIFADPAEPRRSGERRVRRNSESSVMERGGKLLDPEEEKRRQERRRRERRQREAGKDPKTKKPDRKLDIIDQLDATSIYGTGREYLHIIFKRFEADLSVFHHDGPFDACNPHRNRQGSRRAPMQAFPKDSLNNVLGGGGPLNKRPDHATFLGNNDDEAFKDYATGGSGAVAYESYGMSGGRPGPRRTESSVQSALQIVEPVHGDESLGLGTSTFLEGAPASKVAIQRRDTESATPDAGGGLTRKKSLAQKIRGISNNRRDFAPSGRMTSPEGVNNPTSPEPLTPRGSRSIANEANPFFNDQSSNRDGKVESITIVEPENKIGRARAPSSPGRGFSERLERRVTSDGSGNSAEEPRQNMGFLSRVKSLKGGSRRTRPEKPTT